MSRPDPDPRAGRPAAGGDDLSAITRPAWVEIDLDALERNLVRLRERVAPARVLAVIKADAYGHGARHVGLALERAGVAWLGVALLEEGIELRRAGVGCPVLILGQGGPRQIPLLRRYQLTPTLSSRQQLDDWLSWTSADRVRQRIHLKVDTGMARLGLDPAEVPEALAALRRHPSLELAGLLSHFADADDLASPRNAEQERRFAELLGLLTGDERERLEIHLGNSAAALHRPDCRHRLVRLGLALFGHDPTGREEGLEPVMSVVTRIVQLRPVAPGTRVGYGGRWQATRPSVIAVVPVGYADGYPWRLGNQAEALLEGRRVPVVGSVTMDMTLLDVTGVEAGAGSRVVLMGRSGEERITAQELAGRAGTIPYEVLCQLGLRLPRRYRRGGREVGYDSRFRADWP